MQTVKAPVLFECLSALDQADLRRSHHCSSQCCYDWASLKYIAIRFDVPPQKKQDTLP